MKRFSRKLRLRRERLRELAPASVTGGQLAYTTTGDEACSGPCCTKISVSWCVDKGPA